MRVTADEATTTYAEARAEFEQAAALAGNQRERSLLLERAARLGTA